MYVCWFLALLFSGYFARQSDELVSERRFGHHRGVTVIYLALPCLACILLGLAVHYNHK